MWPSAFSIFKGQACPMGSGCEIPNCLFAHDQPAISPTLAYREPAVDSQPPAKRLRTAYDEAPSAAQPTQALSEVADPPVFTGLRASKTESLPPKQKIALPSTSDQSKTNGKTHSTLPQTATKPVSPPPKKNVPDAPAQPEVEVPLLPRKLQNDPMPFAQRIIRLRALHEQMVPFNNMVAKALKPSTKALHLSANQLRKLAVDEEAKIAVENKTMYDNIIKNRLAAYKKMTQEQWVAARREAVAKESGEPSKKPQSKNVETGMSLKEEVMFLSTMYAPQNSLVAHGYVTQKPSAAEIEECKKSQIASDFWEACDRCGTRFQVFPDRREEDGALTSGGKCRHHWGKKMWPKRSKGQESGPARYGCCNEPLGSEGCTESDTHVYKFTDVARMSLVMPFIDTPENPKVKPQTAVCFDCEMGYTTQGFELLRLTVISWPNHRPIIDVLVRPLGHLLDLNTQWSGVTTDQFLNAKKFDPANPRPNRNDLRIVDSPYAARDLFLQYVAPTTPVLGHALENDLNVIRLIHPTIVDTVILYPTRSGLPFRHGLKTLAKQHLDISIQQGGSSGHDSYEDAKTTGELVRAKVADNWKKLKNEGWTIGEDGVYPPLPAGTPPPAAPQPPSMIPPPKMVDSNGSTAVKRKLDDEDGDG